MRAPAASGTAGVGLVPGLQGGWEKRGASGAGAGLRRAGTRAQCASAGSRGAATHLSELEGGDDGDNDAHETDVEPIPVGQAGIGLSL